MVASSSMHVLSACFLCMVRWGVSRDIQVLVPPLLLTAVLLSSLSYYCLTH